MSHELVKKLSMLIEEAGPKLEVRLGILQILVTAWELNADVRLNIVTRAAQHLPYKRSSKRRKNRPSSAGAINDTLTFKDKVNTKSDNISSEEVPLKDLVCNVSQSDTQEDIPAEDNVAEAQTFNTEVDAGTSSTDNLRNVSLTSSTYRSPHNVDSEGEQSDEGNLEIMDNVSDEVLGTTTTADEPSNTDRKTQVSCTICDKLFKNEHDLQMHMGMHTKLSYKCTQCGKTYRSSGPLKRHMMLVHSGEALIEEDGDDGVQKQFSCNICHKIFEHKSNLTQHMRVHTGYPRHQKCTVCGKSYPYCVHIKNHLLEPCAEAVESNDPNGQKCHVCSEDFSSEQDYAAHMQMHNNSYDCDVCQETFSEAKYLVKHRRIHTGEKPCQCEHCGESFADDSELKSHMLVHTVERLSGTRRHECCVCHKTFKMRDELKRHMLLHTRGGPYECPQCRQACSGLPGLKRHMRVHTGSKPFVCGCGMAFTSNGNMMAHMKRRH